MSIVNLYFFIVNLIYYIFILNPIFIGFFAFLGVETRGIKTSKSLSRFSGRDRSDFQEKYSLNLDIGSFK